MKSPSRALLASAGEGRLALSGVLSFDTVPQLQSQLAPWLQRGADTMVDLGGVQRSDSAGLALLVEWLRQSRRRGARLRFRNIPPQMQAMAAVSHVQELLAAEVGDV